MQFLDFKSKLSLLHNLIVEFVPSADCCILRSGECCQWMEIKAVYNQTQEIADPQDRRACERVVEQGYTVHVEIGRTLRDVTFALSRLTCQLGGGCTAHYESPRNGARSNWHDKTRHNPCSTTTWPADCTIMGICLPPTLSCQLTLSTVGWD